MNTSAAEAGLCHGKRAAARAEHVIEGNAHVLVTDVAVIAMTILLTAHADVAHNVDPGQIGRNDKHRRTRVRRRVRIGHRHDDQERCIARVRGKPLLAIDHPVIAVQFRAALEHLRVRAGMRFGHGEAGDDFSIEQWLQKARLLCLGAVVRKDFRVACVRRLTAENDGSESRATKDFIHQAQLQLPVARPTQFRTQMTRPQAARFHLCLQWPHQLLEVRVLNVVGVAQHIVERLDFVTDEFIHPIQFFLKFRVCFEVPSHLASSSYVIGTVATPALPHPH